MENNDEYTTIECAGIGHLRISKKAVASCGGIRKGFAFDYKFPHEKHFCGGVISKESAKQLADTIYNELGLSNPQ